jgi:hypothetical protein
MSPSIFACNAAGQDQASAHHATTPPTPATSPPAARVSGPSASGVTPPPTTASASSSAPTPTPTTPLPPLADVHVLQIVSRQGGPFHPKCGGVISELTVNFVSKQWTRGFCTDESRGASPNPNQPLQKRTGKLTDEQRKRIEAEYAKMSEKPGPSCAADAGRTSLTLRHADRSTTEFVSPGTSCGTTPPRVADDLDEFSSRLFAIVTR